MPHRSRRAAPLGNPIVPTCSWYDSPAQGNPDQWRHRAEWLRCLCVCASQLPQLAAALASSGMLSLVLEEAAAMLSTQNLDIMGERCIRVRLS